MTTARKALKQRASASPRRELPTDDDAYLTKDEVAELLGITRRKVERMVGDRKIASYRIGKLVRIKRSDALAFVEAGKIEAA